MMIQPVMPYHDDRILPSFTLRQIDLPELLAWEVNGQYYLVMKVEMTGIRNMRMLGSKEDAGKFEADFQMLNVRPVGYKPIDAKQLEKEDFNQLVTKVKSGDL